jgi:hypothetical protein
MPREHPSAEPSFGFLSTLESPEYGYFGGYLIVSPLGRPLEFHCTSPVRPSRAQEILYGPTLQPYLIGEQISTALLKAAKVRPRLILVDSEAILPARSVAAAPMAMVAHRPHLTAQMSGEEDSQRQFIAFAGEGGPWRIGDLEAHIVAGNHALILPSGFEHEKHAVEELAKVLSANVDLFEPFGRIHEAIREAQRIGGRGAESHGQAA